MPVPILLAGLGLAAGILGASEHKSAKETNEEAERKVRNAQNMYDNAKESLETAKLGSDQSLQKLGNTKVMALNGSVKQFIRVYDKIKSIQLSESIGLNEISNFEIEDQAVIELKEMSDIYSDFTSSSAAGAATGTVIALAASGTLPLVTGTLSIAGSMLALGNVGAAVGYAGAALSTAVSATPLAAVAAPVILFTGISASMKADENLEKAKTVYAQAEKACEEMKISETLCKAVADRSEMYDNLLNELNGMFSECTQMLDRVIKQKTLQVGNRAINSDDLSVDELELIAVTRALAGAVKAVIDTPILNGEKLSENALEVYDDTRKCLPQFTEDVQNAKEARELSAKAQSLFDNAWKMYGDSRKCLENAQADLADALLELGYTKKNILENVRGLFLPIYDRINRIRINELLESWEKDDYIIDEQDIRQLKEMINVFSFPVPDERVGIAASIVIALAASGFMPIKTGMLQLEGDKLRIEGVEMVAGINGFALAYGASMAPLVWIAVPEVSFDGMSPKMKAKDNYESVRRIFNEAKAASERMQKSVYQCANIVEMAGKVNGILVELYESFFECSNMLDALIKKKLKKSGIEIFEEEDFSGQELELVAVTEALASAIEEIISIPILDVDGILSGISWDVYERVSQDIPKFKELVESVKSYKLVKKNVSVRSTDYKPVSKQSSVEVSDQGYDREKKMNKKAILSLIISIISWIGLLTLFIPIIGGIWSLVNGIISLRGQTKYKSCAIVGIILSALVLFFLLCSIGITFMMMK